MRFLLAQTATFDFVGTLLDCLRKAVTLVTCFFSLDLVPAWPSRTACAHHHHHHHHHRIQASCRHPNPSFRCAHVRFQRPNSSFRCPNSALPHQELGWATPILTLGGRKADFEFGVIDAQRSTVVASSRFDGENALQALCETHVAASNLFGS